MKLITKLSLALACLTCVAGLESCANSDIDVCAKQPMTYKNFDGNHQYRIDTSKSPLTTRTLKIGAFTGIDAAFVDVVVTVGKANGKGRLEAPSNIIDFIEVTSTKGVLKVTLNNVREDGRHVEISGPIRATLYVTAPSIEDISVQLSSCVKFDKGITVEDIDIDTSTSGQVIIPALSVGTCDFVSSTSSSINIAQLSSTGKSRFDVSTSGSITIGNLTASSLKAESSTSGSITLKAGTVKKANFDASTSGSINAEGLSVRTGNISASTSGSVRCNVSDVQSMDESTGGHIRNR